MSDQWFYRMFGEEFGPVTLDKLKELTAYGTLSSSDEIRSHDTGSWVPMSTLEVMESEIGTDTGSLTAVGMDFEIQTSRAANDEWYVLIDGTEFGPWAFDELTRYAENGELSADNQVKLGDQGKWRRVGSIGRLMALLPYKAVEKNIAPSPPKPAPIVQSNTAVDDDDLDLAFELPPIKNETAPVKRNTPPVARRVVEFPPVPTPTPVAKAPPKSGVVSTIEPKSSVVAAAPTAAPQPAVPDIASTQAAFQAAYEQAKAKIAESMLAQADAAFKAAEEQAKSHVAWATGANVDRFWFGWASGVEFGPVEFNQVFGLAKSGQLKPTDFIRNGQFAQFAPASNVPGLFSAVAMIAKATETLNLAKTQAQAAAALAGPSPVVPISLLSPVPAPVAPTPTAAQTEPSAPRSSVAIPMVSAPAPKSNPSVNAVSPRAAEPDPDFSGADLGIDEEPKPARPNPAPAPMMESGRSSLSPGSPYAPSMSGGFSSSSSGMSGLSGMSSSSYAAARPVAVPPKSYPKKSSASDSTWLPDLIDSLKEPKAIGALCAVLLVGLLFGWNYLPKSRSADIRQYNAMRQLIEEIKTKRSSSPGDLPAIQQKLTKLGKEIAADLKDKASRDDPAKQCLLWAARDEIPRFVRAGATTAGSPAEKSLEGRLREAAYELGLEKRPPPGTGEDAVQTANGDGTPKLNHADNNLAL